MEGCTHHLAQANIAKMRAPLDSPRMAGFRSQLAPINAAADRSPGFVWRLQSEAGDATAIRAFEDDSILFNMSVWISLETLRDYVYKSAHRGPMRDRARWFEPLAHPLVLWWIPEGHTPTLDEAKDKLALLSDIGPSAAAFTFRQTYPPPADAEDARGATP